jgi:thiol:disulfide interchange protein/DsbC/DsbD-like thiol-disulfide interchange protein
MKPLRLVALCISILAASFSAGYAQVEASLVSTGTSIQPGRPFTVALRLVHEAHWHTYWLNPGTGLATKLAWKLPDGFKAGEIQWPAPHVLKDATGTVTGSGYDEELFLPVEITPPATLAPGDRITLAATATWLMCQDVCKPGSATLQLTLPVSADVPPSDPQWSAKISQTIARLPQTLTGWATTATRGAKTVWLAVKPAGPVASAPTDLHFFSEDNYIGYELPQDVKPDGQGGFLLALQISPEGPPNPARLLGVLTSETGWQTGGALRGLRIDLPLGEATATVAPNSPLSTPPGGQALRSPLSAAPATAVVSLPATLLLAFVGGLILNLMPCVFPVLGIKILGFVQQAGADRRKVVTHGLVFASGVFLSFWILAGVLAVLRAGGSQLGWGFQLQSPAFVFGLAAVMLVFALNMSGLFEFGLRATGAGAGLQMKSGFTGSFFTGVLATVVATPCSAPFLAPALGAALALSTFESFVVFTAIALGLSLPYLLLSAFPGAVKLLPRPGAWMETFKQFMAFPLYATVGYLVWVLAGQVSENGLLTVFFGLVLIAMGIWVYGRWRAPGASPGRARFGLVGGAVLLALGAWTGWPQPPAPTEVAWEPWSAERVAQLRTEGRPVYVDFTARWCATCQANKKLVFGSEEVRRVFAEKKIATLRGDWTNRDPKITAELERWGRSAVPFDLVYLPGRPAPLELPELLTAGTVLDAVRK